MTGEAISDNSGMIPVHRLVVPIHRLRTHQGVVVRQHIVLVYFLAQTLLITSLQRPCFASLLLCSFDLGQILSIAVEGH